MAKPRKKREAARAHCYRKVAVTLRSLAFWMKDADVRKELYLIAMDYERLAEYAEPLPPTVRQGDAAGYWAS
jgi:hypothetical protein